MPDQTPACLAPAHMPVHADPPELTPAAARGLKWFSAAAIGTWAAYALWPIAAILDGRFAGWPAALFVLMFGLYGAALLILLRLPCRARPVPLRLPLALALVQTITGIALTGDTMRYLHGNVMGLALLVIVAAELPYFLPQRTVWTWVALQTAALTAAMSEPVRPLVLETATFVLAAIGFQVFAAACSMLALSEGRARTSLARTNAELIATRELLAASSRSAERLRISRDLHDTLGHHLTALSLQLDVAARLCDGKAAEHVRQAHAITRLLLGDVRDVVGTLRETSRLNLADAIRALATQPVGARVHLDLPEEALAVDDAERAEAVLRAVQEALTNTARHSLASNQWIKLEQSDEGVTLLARDDGRGGDGVVWGNGLRGMQERFARHGGRVEILTAAGEGFELRAFMPARPSA
ncbi:MAG TPA: sensor histidine kinase [Gammaproteobacteria bacterium]|nr:sensor histidine kinase [Gammaproteobacteria bacterium]